MGSASPPWKVGSASPPWKVGSASPPRTSKARGATICRESVCHTPNLDHSEGFIYSSSSLAPKGSKVKLYKLLSFTIVRQHRLWASAASIWPCRTASNAQISRKSSCTKTCPYAVLRIRDVGCSKLLGQLTLVPNECLLSRASRSDTQILSNSSCNLLIRPYSFALN